MKTSLIRFGIEELKFLHSFNDLRILYRQKLPFLVPRLTGGHVRESAAPPSIQIEPTNHCNLHCTCCSRDGMRRERGYMDMDLFRKIVSEASEVGVRRIHLYLHGEPMLHPRIADMVGFTKSKGLGVTITTNGMMLGSDRICALLNSGMNSADYITFSVLGHSKAVHEKIMKGVDHERVMRNIQELLRRRKLLKANGPVVEAVFYIMPENAGEEELFYRYWRRVVDHARIAGKISEQFHGADSLPTRVRTCKNLWERMTVMWNGDVTLCIADLDGDCIFGNLRESSIVEMWNSPELTYIKKMHRQKKFEELSLCSRCDW